MVTRPSRDRSLPTFISLVVLGILLMTFDVRLQGEGVVQVLRSGTQAVVAPLQKAAAFVVNPVADVIDSMSNVVALREENEVLRAELAEAEADLVAVQDQIARLELFEQLYALDSDIPVLGRTVANVIGRPDPSDASIIIDKGTSEGIVVGQPVIDTNGYVVGTVRSVSLGTATVVPITAGREAITVLVGSQVGIVTPQVFSSEMSLTIDMRLEVFDAREPVLAGDRVVTSSVSSSYPAGLPVGVIVFDAVPSTNSLTAVVRPFVDPDRLRLVVVLAWPPDPLASTDTTTTTVPATTTSTTGEG